IRDEIAALNRRAADAGREIAEIGTRREIARSAKLAEQSASIIAAVNARFGGRLGALQPPPKPEPFLALETTISRTTCTPSPARWSKCALTPIRRQRQASKPPPIATASAAGFQCSN